jgi:hypothetical protein
MPEAQGPTSKDRQAALKRNRSLRSLAAVALAGGAVAAVMYLPGVTVDPEGPVNPSNPYPISFTISDANFIPLENVNAYLEICYVVAAPAPAMHTCQRPDKTLLFKADWRNHSLSTDQQFSITLDDFLRFAAPTKFGGADVSIIVEYQPLVFPIRQERTFRFATELGTDGKLYWISRSVDE